MKTVGLDVLLRAIAGAVASSQESMRKRHISNFASFFRKNEGDVLDPAVVSMKLPRDHFKEGDPPHRVADVPLATLTHHNQAHLQELRFEIDCHIDDLTEGEEEGSEAVSLVIGSTEPRAGAARLTLSYRTNETPEGIAQINDTLLRNDGGD